MQEEDIYDDTTLITVYRYCATIVQLANWTDYEVSIRAWAGNQLSMASDPVLAITRRDCEYA